MIQLWSVPDWKFRISGIENFHLQFYCENSCYSIYVLKIKRAETLGRHLCRSDWSRRQTSPTTALSLPLQQAEPSARSTTNYQEETYTHIRFRPDDGRSSAANPRNKETNARTSICSVHNETPEFILSRFQYRGYHLMHLITKTQHWLNDRFTL